MLVGWDCITSPVCSRRCCLQGFGEFRSVRVGFLRGISDRVNAAKGFVVVLAFPKSARVDSLT